jgi:bifunctional non-homologous end joining protein LigD
VATATKRKRTGRIFIDWLRNERGATAIAPYSLRARAGAPIATPVAWRELARTDSAAAYTLDNIDRRLASLRSDPWPGYATLRQSLTQAQLESIRDSFRRTRK